jgi:hypothetical protein
MAEAAPMNCKLAIEAPAGTVVKVRYRGDRDEEDEDQAIVHEGAIPAGGELSIAVPCAYLVVLAPGYEVGIADFSGNAQLRKVTLKKR